MVHGWTSTSVHTEQRTGAFDGLIDMYQVNGQHVAIPRSLIGSLQVVPGAAVFTFDYHQWSARWVTDDHIGPALARAIDCLHAASGEKVIVVGHSMGGLATRYALGSRSSSGAPISSMVSSVVTFGTPNTGSLAALVGQGAVLGFATSSPAGAAIGMILAACGRVATQNMEANSPCAVLPAFLRAFEGDAAQALTAGSKALSQLAGWPKGVAVTALGGDDLIDYQRRLGFFALPWSTSSVAAGDFLVSPGSAIDGANSHDLVGCHYQASAARFRQRPGRHAPQAHRHR